MIIILILAFLCYVDMLLCVIDEICRMIGINKWFGISRWYSSYFYKLI